MKPKPQTVYKKGGYTVIFAIVTDQPTLWSWWLSYHNELLVDSANDEYASLSAAKRGFRAATRAMMRFPELHGIGPF